MPPTSSPHKKDFFRGKTVLITGGSGFVGKLLAAKLASSCPGIARVLLLVRPKRMEEKV